MSSVQVVHAANTKLHISRVLLQKQIWRSSSLFVSFITTYFAKFIILFPYIYSTDCYSTNQCNGTMVNFTKNSIDCCDGFAQGEPMEPEAGAAGESFSFFKNRNSLRTEGCPVSKLLENYHLSILII